jgi:eukaryotic-like serine/threonine-protein kinase
MIPLPPDFRFAHEPLDETSRGQFVGREHELMALVDRMVHSRGGAILITGYRGVGKTSFVNQALAEFEERSPGCRVVPVHLNLARPVTPLELMFLVLRCIYLELRQSGLWKELASDVMGELALSYNRTMMTIKETRSAVADLSFSAPEVAGAVAGVNVKTGSLFGYKRSRTQGGENTYLTYDERGAEYDLIRIARRLRGAWIGKTAWWQRPFRRSAKPKGDLRIIFVFDELDKIEDPAALDDLFSMLKNVFTTSGLTFMFVAGKDIQERWGAEVRRGESIYESVFVHEVYLPCLWTQARNCCIPAFLEHSTPEAETIWRAISFQGRGIPRRILRSFHSMVRFENDSPLLAVTPYEYRDAEFYAGIEEVLESFRERPSNLTDADKRLLGLYYLVDWILDRGTREFTLADVIAAYEALNNKLVFTGTMASQIEAVIRALQSRGYIEKAGSVDEKQFLKREDAAVPRYRVARSNLPENEAHKSPYGQKEIRFGPYLALAPISSGGIGRVIRALDSRTSEVVAIKYVREPSREVRSIFVREAEVLSEISHNAIPRFRASDLEGDTVWIAMDFVDAASLHRVLLNRGKLPEEAVVYAATAIAHICDSLHSSGYVYGDLKPSNILVTRHGKVVLIDFSTTRRVDANPVAFGVFGTPAYMPPELLEGEPNSIKADIYAWGVLTYELLCGRAPFLATVNYEQLIARIKNRSLRAPSVIVPVSPVLESLILRCMDPDPEKRPAGMAEVLATISSLSGSQEALANEIGDQGAPAAATHSEDRITSIPDGTGPESQVAAAPAPPASYSTPPITVVGELPPRSGSRWKLPHFGRGTSPRPAPPLVPVGAPFDLRSPQPQGSPASAPGAGGPPAPTVLPADATPLPTDPSSISWVPVTDIPGPPRTVLESAFIRVLPNDPQQSARIFPLRGSVTRIGRSFESEVCIDNAAFSRTHALITLEDGVYWLRDAGSLNGTSVNGRRLSSREPVRLADNDRIEIGDFVIQFEAPRATVQEAVA